MKYSLISLLQCFLLSAVAQTGTIHVKKADNTNCNFKLIADSSLINTTCEVSSIDILGKASEDADELMRILNYTTVKGIIVSKATFENDLRNHCDTKESKLVKVEVKELAPGKINITFLFRKK